MNYALGDMVPAALAVALSPFPIIAIVIVLSTPRARTTGPLFALGWVLGLVAVSTVVVLLLGNVDKDSEASTLVSVLRILLGAALLTMAAQQWFKRPRKGEGPEQPPWMATVGRATPRRTLVLGLALAGANPKNLALTLAASASISKNALGALTCGIVCLCRIVPNGKWADKMSARASDETFSR